MGTRGDVKWSWLWFGDDSRGMEQLFVTFINRCASANRMAAMVVEDRASF